MTASLRSSSTRVIWCIGGGRRAAERVDHGRRSASPSWCIGDLPERQKGDGGGISGAGGRGREGRASGLRSDSEGAHTAPHGRLTSCYRVGNGHNGARLPRVGARAASPPARPRSCEAGRQSGAASRALAWAANKAPHSRAPGLNADRLEVSELDSSAFWANAVVVSCARCGESRTRHAAARCRGSGESAGVRNPVERLERPPRRPDEARPRSMGGKPAASWPATALLAAAGPETYLGLPGRRLRRARGARRRRAIPLKRATNCDRRRSAHLWWR